MTTIKRIDKFNQEDYIERKDGKEIIELPEGEFRIVCSKNCEIVCWKNCEIECVDDCEIECVDDCEIVCGKDCKIECGDNCKITAGKGTKVTGWFKGWCYHYEFKERKTILFKDGEFKESEK